MDCSLGKTPIEDAQRKLIVMTEVVGQPVGAIIDAGCAQALLRADLVPCKGYTPTTPIKMHDQGFMYPSHRIPVMAQRVTRAMPG